MGYKRALLVADAKRERQKLEEQAERKDLWGSIGRTAGGLLAMGITGGIASPFIAGSIMTGATAVGGAIGSGAAGEIDEGKFYKKSRKDLKKQLNPFGTQNLMSALKSGITTGMAQKYSLMKAGETGKGLDFKGSFFGKGLDKMKSKTLHKAADKADVLFGSRMPSGAKSGETMLRNIRKQQSESFKDLVSVGGTGTINPSTGLIEKPAPLFPFEADVSIGSKTATIGDTKLTGDVFGAGQKASRYRPNIGGTRELWATGETPQMQYGEAFSDYGALDTDKFFMEQYGRGEIDKSVTEKSVKDIFSSPSKKSYMEQSLYDKVQIGEPNLRSPKTLSEINLELDLEADKLDDLESWQNYMFNPEG